MNTFIVITSIFHPTKAVNSYAKLRDSRVVVVGDKKSPDTYFSDGVKFISWTEQESSSYRLQKFLPYNHYCRKMMGYIYAIENDADVIIDTDDDNIPKDDFKFPSLSGDFKTLKMDLGFVNIYELYSKDKIWPRGLPLRLINSRTIDNNDLLIESQKIGIWQGLADNDPDVDAIYRLTNGKVCNFDYFGNIVLGSGTASPFNSQNTLFRKEMFPLLYLPTTVTFRFTDILRGFVAQPVMWATGFQLGFTDATVVQERNPHDYTKDFESEVPMYLYGEKAFDLCMVTVKPQASVADNLFNCYSELTKAGIVKESELPTLAAWLDDLANI
ncbi:MAG: hypothetical protein FD157_4038 [Rhodocyclaceae bacterium]|nr:MAG: hypothetical protein FD157_4038 [Rhodocyclaceae bacterium]TNC98520.1 MAG: hypothetical protein FD118_4024 [Rhodocyclaceae bacterium]